MLRLLSSRAVAVIATLLLASCSSDSKPGEPADSGTDTGTDTDDDGGNNECDEVDFALAGRPPSFVILLDRSYSMALGDQWEYIVQALNEITAQMDNQIRFALMMFPNQNGLCMPAPLIPSVPLADHNSAEIEQVLYETTPFGPGTPTATSLLNAYLYLLGEDDGSPMFVMLATDGAPNCSTDPTMDCDTCVSSDPGDNCEDPFFCLDDQMTYAQVVEYHDNWGINTYVVGMGQVIEIWDQVMSNIAEYGGTEDFYPADTPETVSQALQEIAAETTECTFEVDWESLEEGASTDPDLVNVYADGYLVGYSGDCQNEYGWRWLDEDTIELCEGLCHDYRWGVVSAIGATFGCETFVE
jgi:hypothetical protein